MNTQDILDLKMLNGPTHLLFEILKRIDTSLLSVGGDLAERLLSRARIVESVLNRRAFEETAPDNFIGYSDDGKEIYL